MLVSTVDVVCLYFTYILCIDGQKIAIRLSRRIDVVSKQLKNTLSKYNSGLNELQQLTWEEATDLSNELYRGSVFASNEIPPSVKLQAVQQNHRIARAQEEIVRLKEEMDSCARHFIEKYQTISDRIKELDSNSNSDLFTKGSLCLLKRCRKICSFELKLLQCFLKYVTLPQLENKLQCIEAEDVLMDLEETNCDDADTGDVSVRCSEPSHSIIFEEDDNDENLDFIGE